MGAPARVVATVLRFAFDRPPTTGPEGTTSSPLPLCIASPASIHLGFRAGPALLVGVTTATAAGGAFVPWFGLSHAVLWTLGCGVAGGVVSWMRLPAPAVLSAVILCYGFHAVELNELGALAVCALSLSSCTRRRVRMLDAGIRVAAISAGWLGACAAMALSSNAPSTWNRATLVVVTGALFLSSIYADRRVAAWVRKVREGQQPDWSVAREGTAERQPPRLIAESFSFRETASTTLCRQPSGALARRDRGFFLVHQDSGWLPALMLDVVAGVVRALTAIAFAALVMFGIGLQGERSPGRISWAPSPGVITYGGTSSLHPEPLPKASMDRWHRVRTRRDPARSAPNHSLSAR